MYLLRVKTLVFFSLAAACFVFFGADSVLAAAINNVCWCQTPAGTCTRNSEVGTDIYGRDCRAYCKIHRQEFAFFDANVTVNGYVDHSQDPKCNPNVCWCVDERNPEIPVCHKFATDDSVDAKAWVNQTQCNQFCSSGGMRAIHYDRTKIDYFKTAECNPDKKACWCNNGSICAKLDGNFTDKAACSAACGATAAGRWTCSSLKALDVDLTKLPVDQGGCISEVTVLSGDRCWCRTNAGTCEEVDKNFDGVKVTTKAACGDACTEKEAVIHAYDSSATDYSRTECKNPEQGPPTDYLDKAKLYAKEQNQLKFNTLQEFIGQIIYFLTGIMGTILFAFYVYAGILWMTAVGNTERIESAKQIVLWATLGIVVILSSYLIVTTLFFEYLKVPV